MRITIVIAFLFIFICTVLAQQADLTAFEWGVMPTASASVADMSFRPRFATDGKPDTGWIAPADYQPLWLRLEWRFPVTVSQVSLRQFPQAKVPDLGALGKLSLEADVQGQWQPIASADATTTPPAEEIKFVLAQPVRTMALRLVVQSATGKHVGVSEVKVTGEAPSLPLTNAPAWTGYWIWSQPSLLIPHTEPTRRYFRQTFTVPDPATVKSAWLLGATMDRGTIWLNAKEALHDFSRNGGEQRDAVVKEIPHEWLLPGENVLSAQVEDLYEVGGQGLLAELVLLNHDGTRTIVATNEKWLGQADPGVWPDWQKPGYQDARWVPATYANGANARWQWLPDVPYPVVAPAETMRLTGLQLTPTKLFPGQRGSATLTFDVAAPPKADYAIILRLGQNCTWRDYDYELWGAALTPAEAKTSQWAPGQHTVKLDFDVPAESPSAMPATLLVSLPSQAAALTSTLPGATSDAFGLHLTLPVDRGTRPVAVPAANDFPDTKIKTIDGNPTFTVAGKPTAPIIWSSAYGNYKRYADYAASGVKIFRPIMGGYAIPAPGEEEDFNQWWLGQVDQMVNAALSVDPDIQLMPAVWMDPNPDCLFKDPSEIYVSGRGQMVIPLGVQVPDRGQARPTFMSQAWRRAGAESLTRLVKHMRSQPYASHILGLILFAGRAGENYYGGNELNLFMNEQGQYDARSREQWDTGDFSMAARRTFREFLIRKYQTDAALQAAWQQPAIHFDDLLDPSRFRREEVVNTLVWANKPKDAGTFRDPLTPGVGLMPMDYFQCFSEAMADSFIAWGKSIKLASDNRLVTGCYYGYTLAQLFTAVPGYAGHTAVDRAIRDPNIDIFVSPPEYDNDRRAGGHLWAHDIVDSMRLHNKLMVYESDTRTYLSDIPPKQYSLAETLEVLKRDACASILRGSGWWWYEFSTGQRGADAREWFDDPQILSLAGKLKRLYDFSLTLPDRGPSAQLAVFYHGETHPSQDLFPPTLPLDISLGRLTLINGMQNSGMAYDLYNLADLPDLAKSGKLSQYRLCVFLNSFYLQPDELGLLDLAKGGGRTLVWMYAPGLCQPGKHLDPANIAQITGMPGVRLSTDPVEPTMRFTTQSPVTAGLPANYELVLRPTNN